MGRLRIILQARTTSHRLPAKVLLPIAGRPLALLCAERLRSSGQDLLLATSSDSTDDTLATLAEQQGINVHRGSLDNVAHRFLEASADLADDDILVRATADNPVPDGAFVEAMLEDFLRAGADYLGPHSYGRELPIGLGVEILKMGALRKSLTGELEPEAAEHVTTRLSKERVLLEAPSFDPEGMLKPTRMTVDTLDDYLIAERAFRLEGSNAAAPWRNIADRFTELRGNVPGASA